MTTPNGSGPNGARPDGRSPLRTEPRPYWMHVMVDAIIGFLLTAFLLWLFGVPLWVMILVGWVIGFAAAPFTQRWEADQLSARRRDS